MFVHFLCPLQSTPPRYNVHDMKVPTALFSGGQDTLADPKDVAVLITQVSRPVRGTSRLHARHQIRKHRNILLIFHLLFLKEISVSPPVRLLVSPPVRLSVTPPVSLQVSHLIFHQHIDHWEHLDFIWGLDAPQLMFPSILKLLQENH